MVELYTLSTCPICEVVKKKLNAKSILYAERPFEELPSYLKVDRAPVLKTEDKMHEGFSIYLLTPSEINDWIKAQEG